MPLLEDSALVHEPPPRLPGIRGPQIGRHRWVPKAPRLLSEALSFLRLQDEYYSFARIALNVELGRSAALALESSGW